MGPLQFSHVKSPLASLQIWTQPYCLCAFSMRLGKLDISDCIEVECIDLLSQFCVATRELNMNRTTHNAVHVGSVQRQTGM